MAKTFEKYQEHLGDGVYVEFDGFHITLAANHHLNIVIALDPDVQERLINYINKIKEIYK